MPLFLYCSECQAIDWAVPTYISIYNILVILGKFYFYIGVLEIHINCHVNVYGIPVKFDTYDYIVDTCMCMKSTFNNKKHI